MISKIDLLLSNVGFAVFDPDVLQLFKTNNNLSANLFDDFQRHSTVGDEAIRSGVVIPVYSIPPLDYQIIVNVGQPATTPDSWQKFITNPFPLHVSGDRIVVSDLDALFDWDYSFYKTVKNSSDKLPYNAVPMQPGNYAVRIRGFCETQWNGSGPVNKGYELLVEAVEQLPAVAENVDSDSTNYVVYGSVD